MAGEHQVEGATVALAPGLRRRRAVLRHVGRRCDPGRGREEEAEVTAVAPASDREPGARRVPGRGEGLARGERGTAQHRLQRLQEEVRGLPPDPRGGAGRHRRVEAVAGQDLRGRLRRADRRARVRRARAHQRARAHLAPGVGPVRDRHRRVRGRARHGRAHDSRARHRGAEEGVRPAAAPGREGVVPALQRARRRLRPRRAHHPRRARRRRVDRQRPEGLELLRPRRRLGHPARPHRLGRPQAPRDHLLPGRHDDPRRRGAAAAPDHRRRPLQRDVPHRRPHPGRQPARRAQRRVGGRADDADERARADRHLRWRRPRLPRSGSSSRSTTASSATPRSASASPSSTRAPSC